MERKQGVLFLVLAMLFIVAIAGVSSCGGSSGGDSDGDSTDGDSTDGDADGDNPLDLSCLEMLPLRLWATDPSVVAMLYRIETCDGQTVVFDPAEGESIFDYYTITENGQPLSSEAVPDVDRSDRQRAYVTLMLDFSLSTRPVEAELIAATIAFGESLMAASDRIWVGVKIFDGRNAPATVLLPTPDVDELRTALQDLVGYRDPNADDGSTNLNGAVADGVESLRMWQAEVMQRNDQGLVTTGYLVAFTDGLDTADRRPLSDASTAVESARSGDPTIGTNVQTYAVALQGDDYTAQARSNLLEILGGSERYLYEGDLDELTQQFNQLAARIADQVKATHLFKYCSAARSGQREVVLGVNPNVGTANSEISFSFSADGFSGGCADFIETVCVNRACGGFNCGGCDDRSEVCESENGRCVDECVDQDQCSGEEIETSLGYERVCGPATLGEGVRRCGNLCVDTMQDDDHCGGCNKPCDTGDGERCESGLCSCPSGLTRCNDVCREASWYDDNPNHCGQCDRACANGGTCTGGQCQCAAGWEGETCETSQCDPPCQNGGTCSADQCQCPNGWEGETCETSQCATPCQNGGICVGPNTCDCTDGWEGETCETSQCATPCQNGGICVGPNTCECADGWVGATCENLDGTWYDSSSGLTWQNPPADSSMDWEDAKDYCSNLSLAGFSNWRLPQIGDLRSLIRGCPSVEIGGLCDVRNSCNYAGPQCGEAYCSPCLEESGPADGCYWPNEMEGECSRYWSSSPVENSDEYAWGVNFYNSSLYWYGEGNFEVFNNVRCVRGAPGP